MPGRVFTSSIHITNDETEKKEYFITIQKFLPSGEAGQQNYLPLWDTSGLPSWTYVAKSSIVLLPGEEREVPFSIRIPQTASPGGYYAAIFFSSQPPVQGEQGRVVTSERTGSLLLITVEGELVHRWNVDAFSLRNGSPIRSLPIVFETMVKNTGNTHEIPQGTITIKNYFGSVVEKLAMNPEGNRVLPNSARRYEARWQHGPSAPVDGFFAKALQQARQFAIGRYTATLEIQGQEGAVVEWRQQFSVWPKELLICFALILLLIIILMRLYGRWVIYRAVVK